MSLKKLKQKRGGLRAALVKSVTAYADASLTLPEREALYIVLMDQGTRLQQLDAQIQEILDVSDEEFAAEVDTCEGYVHKVATIKAARATTVQMAANPETPPASMLPTYRFQKLQPVEFDLSPSTWTAFWGQFKGIHDDARVATEDKFQYLLRCLKPGTKGHRLASSYPPFAANYAPMIDHLTRRFGREDLVVDASVRALLSMVTDERQPLSLSELTDFLGSHVRTLQAFGVGTDKYQLFLYPLLEKCLPQSILELWLFQTEKGHQTTETQVNEELDDAASVTTSSKGSDSKVNDLLNFLERMASSKEQAASLLKKQKASSSVPMTKGREEPTATAAGLHVGAATKPFKATKIICIFCDGGHPSQECGKALKMTVADRKAAITAKRACLRCLKLGHSSYHCKRFVSCIVCQRQHYTIICDSVSDNKSPKSESPSTCFASSTGVVYLKTLRAKSASGRTVRVFLDDGAHQSYIREAVARDLGLCASDAVYMSTCLFGGQTTETRRHLVYNLDLCALDGGPDDVISFTVLGQPTLCQRLAGVHDVALLADLERRGIVLTDTSSRPQDIDILLGSDMIPRLVTGRLEVLETGVVATHTRLGWCIQGVGKTQLKQTVTHSLTCFSKLQSQVDLEQRLWGLEILGVEPDMPNGDDNAVALQHFQETTTINSDGRYVVSLPWRSGHPPLPTHKGIAESRLENVHKRLIKMDMFTDYNTIFQEWESDGIIEVAPPTAEAVHYLPHHPVLKQQSRTTKIRPVFDASVKSVGGVSLNDCLHTGPNLTPLTLPLILRFRRGQFGVSADIKKAFLMLELAEADRDMLRFFWFKNGRREEFRHCRVVFGVASSPFLLNAAISDLLETSDRDPCGELSNTVRILQQSFYVDNCLSSFDTLPDLQKFQEQARALLRRRFFDLRGWMSNHAQVREIERVQEEMVLGIRWLLDDDGLAVAYVHERLPGTHVTKRKLLSIANGVYDPLGMLSPVTLVPKLLLQEAWKQKFDWDDQLPPDMLRRFNTWYQSMALAGTYTIPRCIMVAPPSENATLHVFCDASAAAYATCAFLRTDSRVTFVAARTRVSPLQPLSIPRLELMGALLAARLAQTIVEALQARLETYWWTDSTVVLAWLKRDDPWKTFVANRVQEIRRLTTAGRWRHVPGTLNPADLPSRGCDMGELIQQAWAQGPPWLRGPPNTWPTTEGGLLETEGVLTEMKCLPKEKEPPLVSTHTTVLCAEEIPFSQQLTRYFSQYTKMRNMVAWMLRWLRHGQPSSARRGALTAEEIDLAEKRLFFVVQEEGCLRSLGSPNLRMRKGPDDLLRVTTKIIMSKDVQAFKEPIVLVDNPIVRLYITHLHVQAQHAGIQTTLILLRDQVWLIRARKVVRQVLHKCLACKKQEAKPIIPIEGPLPPDRVERVASFEVTGVDLAGPLFLKSKEKAWVVLFTCAVYRAVHFELVTSLSTEAFLQAVRRMTARRGQVATFYCDNGTNFVGASSALASLNWDDVKAKGATAKIKFRFITPASPWFGGWWEVMVKLMKRLLKRSLGNAYLTYEELLTVLCDCERTVNARPLTYVADDATELMPLTPAMFLHEPRTAEDSNVVFDMVDATSLNKRVIHLQKIREHLKVRFRDEYLSQLVNYHQNRAPHAELKAGDIVLVASENTKRLQWPLARVLEVHPGRDGTARVARVKTATAELLRPWRKLVPLEIHDTAAREGMLRKVREEAVGGDLQQQVPTTAPPQRHVIHDQHHQVPELVFSTRGRAVKKPQRLDL